MYLLIWPAIRAVGNGTATYGDLSLIAHYAKVVMSEKADSSTTGHEVAAMAALLGGMRESGEPIQDKEQFSMFARDLKTRRQLHPARRDQRARAGRDDPQL